MRTDQGIWRYDYDTEDRLWKVTDPFGNIREREYDVDGNVKTVKVNGKEVATYTYTDGNLTQRTDAMGQPYTFEYTDGQLTRQEDPEGAFVEYDYDEQGRLWITRDGNGNEIVREYAVVDDSGSSCSTCSGSSSASIKRLHKIVYPTFTKEFVYDPSTGSGGRVSEEIYHLSDTESYSVTFAYDAFGRLESTTGPDNQTTSYVYDRLGRRILMEDPSGQTQFEYDLWDNLVALIDAENQRTEFEYYPDGKLWKERRPMGEETTYEYDTLGRLWKVTDAKSQTTEYGYDAQSRIETIAYADGKTVTLSYDADGNLAGYSDGTTSATYTYDDMGRKTWERVNYGPFTKEYSYSYYGNGLKHTFTAPDSTVYTYLYGLNNELQDIQIPSLGSITIPAYTWNRPATVNYPGGTQRSYTYDALMRLQSLTALDPGSNSILDYSYTYDSIGNIETKTTEHGAYTYEYDNSSRLTIADHPVLADESYTYDDVGNRLTAAGVAGTWNYNDNNELLGYADVEYDYDANGNMIQKRVGTAAVNYIYDAANRLIKVEDDVTQAVIAEYYYDPFGRRLWKDVGGTKTYFFYSEEGLIAEYNENGVESKSYGYKPDSTWTTDPLWLKEGGSYYWYQNDHLGTPQKLIDSGGVVVWSAQYNAFGEAKIDVQTVENNLRFPGQFYDDETGLQYNWFRYYDPRIGRYVSADPIGLIGGINLYTYTRNNSINFIDPIGQNEVVITGGINMKYHGWEVHGLGPITELPFIVFRKLGVPHIAHDRYWGNFVDAAITEIQKRKTEKMVNPCEDIEWHVENISYYVRSYWDEGNIYAYHNEIKRLAEQEGVILRWFSNKDDFVSNINHSPQGTRREGFERISLLEYFGHGGRNQFMLQYNNPYTIPAVISSDDILAGVIEKTAFTEYATVVSYACWGATPNSSGQTLRDTWEAYFGVDFYGVDGRTSYYDPERVVPTGGARWVPESPPFNPNPIPPNFPRSSGEPSWSPPDSWFN